MILRRSWFQSTRGARALVCRRWPRRLWRMRRPTWWTPPPSVFLAASALAARRKDEAEELARSMEEKVQLLAVPRVLSGHRSSCAGSTSSALSLWPARGEGRGRRGRKRKFLVAALVVDNGSVFFLVMVRSSSTPAEGMCKADFLFLAQCSLWLQTGPVDNDILRPRLVMLVSMRLSCVPLDLRHLGRYGPGGHVRSWLVSLYGPSYLAVTCSLFSLVRQWIHVMSVYSGFCGRLLKMFRFWTTCISGTVTLLRRASLCHVSWGVWRKISSPEGLRLLFCERRMRYGFVWCSSCSSQWTGQVPGPCFLDKDVDVPVLATSWGC